MSQTRSSRSAVLLDDLRRALAESDESVREELRVLLGITGSPARWLTAREKAEQLGLHPETVVKMARSGRLPAEKVGRAWRFRGDRAEVPAPTASLRFEAMPPARPRSTPRRSVAAIREAGISEKSGDAA